MTDATAGRAGRTLAHSAASGPGLLLATLGAIAFCGKAIIVKLAYRYGVDAVTLIMYRMLFALPLFALLAWWAGRGKPALDAARLARRARAGLLAATTSRASSTSPGWPTSRASLERLILYLNPTLVLLFGWLALPAARHARQVVALAISYAGVLLVFGHEVTLPGRATSRSAPRWCSLSAVSYAVYLVYSGEFVKRLGSLRLVGLATSVACVLCIVQFLLLRPLTSALAVAPRGDLAVGAQRHACAPSLPVLMVMMAIERIGARDGGADRHGRADVDHPDGRADPRRAVHRVDRGRHGCWCIAGIFVFTRTGAEPEGIDMDLGIAGKRALVCGASKGLGYGCAQALVREGVNVVIVARGAEALRGGGDEAAALAAARGEPCASRWRATSRPPRAARRCSRCPQDSTSWSTTPAARRPATSATGTARPGSRRSTPTC